MAFGTLKLSYCTLNQYGTKYCNRKMYLNEYEIDVNIKIAQKMKNILPPPPIASKSRQDRVY